MTVDRAYRHEGLSIGQLALCFGLPEYRLRQLINQGLGYRNFAAFLNFYRLADAKTALADPDQAEVPILTIALDAGFNSLGPFNRAFKAETGMTPSEFRRLRPPAAVPCEDFRNRQAGFQIRHEEISARRDSFPASTIGSEAEMPSTNRIRPSCAVVAGAAILAGCGNLDRAASVPTHYVSHQMCSAVFVGGLDPDVFYREAVEPVIAPAGLLMDYRIDRNKREVTADLAGLVTSRSVFLSAEGCRVAHEGAAAAPMDDDPPAPAKHAAVQLPVDPLASLKVRLATNITRGSLLDEPRKYLLLRHLADMPEGDRLCHGDFHPWNVLGDASQPIVIDWPDACRGDPAADACRSYLLLKLNAEEIAEPYLDGWCRVTESFARRSLTGCHTLRLRDWRKMPRMSSTAWWKSPNHEVI